MSSMKSSKYLVILSCFLISSLLQAKDYVVKYKTEAQFQAGLFSFKTQFNSNIKATHKDGKLLLVDLKEGSDLALLKADHAVEYVIENYKFQMFSSPLTNDPQSDAQWALKKVKASEAWGYTQGSPSVIVAVIDTGINWEHEDLAKQIWWNKAEIENNGKDDDNNGYVDDVRGWDFFGNDNNPDDETSSRNPGHGTHCAGIVGATGNNQVGISGMAQNVTLMPIRFLGADGSGDLMNAVKAIDYATNNGAQIISASWGAPVSREQAKPILEAIERARDKGVIFVAAAANDGKSNDFTEVYPANGGFSNMISVAASGSQDEKPSWSNFGRATITLAAPGLDILSTLPGNSYGKLSGTSMATPLVSGLVALVLSHAKALGKTMTPEEVRVLLEGTSDPVDIETASGGRVLASGALKALTENKLIVSPYSKTLEAGETLQIGALGAEGALNFSVSNPEVASISEEGLVTAKAEGQFSITVKDASGDEASSTRFFVGKGEAPTDLCPFEQPMLCQMMCQMNPSLPWCQ